MVNNQSIPDANTMPTEVHTTVAETNTMAAEPYTMAAEQHTMAAERCKDESLFGCFHQQGDPNSIQSYYNTMATRHFFEGFT